MPEALKEPESFWSLDADVVLNTLQTGKEGLNAKLSEKRMAELKKASRQLPQWKKDALLLFSQFRSPLILLLVIAVVLSTVMGEYSDAIVIFSILLLSGLLGFIQERNAGRAVEKLLSLVKTRVRVKREGQEKEVDMQEVVQGDIILLKAGDLIPADCLILDSQDLHTNESVLTGESFPVEKKEGVSPAEAPLARRSNALFKGSSVVNGMATAVAVKIGDDTELGKISKELGQVYTETDFEKGIRRFGFLLMRIALFLAGGILIINLLFHRPLVDSILFALALSVGLAPELLPAIVTITLSAGARRMAKEKVIVKKLSSIQNLGAVTVFCSDKTGTLTEGIVQVQGLTDLEGQENEKLRLYAYLNASFESGFQNPLDNAIRQLKGIDAGRYKKFDEVPYDFIRKRLSVVAEIDDKHIMISKGAVSNIMEACTRAELPDGSLCDIETVNDKITRQFESFSSEGYRVLSVAWKDVTGDPVINKDDEQELIFLGFIVLNDPPRPGSAESLDMLHKQGIELKLITGDNRLAAKNIAEKVGMKVKGVITGKEMQNASDDALTRLVVHNNVFAEIEPNQKERLVRALQKAGKVVGFLGDGINDAPAIKAADVGVSVSNAVDVAREAADMVLLEKDLKVLLAGIREGRKTFINSLKYIFITTSANFGNMFSMAGAALFLPFLPLLPIQILLNNFISDIPALAIASDKVDEELLSKPRKWDLKMIRNFMIVFGIQSSLFDFLTFGTLLYVFHANESVFRTGWFIESVLTEIVILLIIRTRRPVYRSVPSRPLLLLSLITTMVVLLLPYTPLASVFSLIPLSIKLMAGLTGITLLYMISSELTKAFFFKRMN